MSSAKTTTAEITPVKKILKKKQSVKPVVDVVEKVKKEVDVVKTKAVKATKVKVETKKEVKKETKKEAKKEVDEEKKVTEKTPKKINVKPTLADTQGLNLSVAKVKNIISNLCINKDTFLALKEIKEHRVFTTNSEADVEKNPNFTFVLDGLSVETINYLELCAAGTYESKGLAYSRIVTKQMSKNELTRYEEEKRLALVAFQKDQKNEHLFKPFEFDLMLFNKSFDAKFYDNMDESELVWKSQVDMELYKTCVDLVNKSKVRFNSESKIFITAFVEYIIKQLVINGTKHCIDDKKKIIQLFHALSKTSTEFTMFPFIASSKTYKKYLASSQVESEEDVDDEVEIEVDADDEVDTTDRKLQFRYYVAELCRNVRMELSSIDTEDSLLSKFNQTSVSKDFKNLCSNLIIELLQQFGNILSVEVQTRSVKTVNYSILHALIQNAHIFHNIDSTATIKFIQEKYNIHSVFLQQRQEKRA